METGRVQPCSVCAGRLGPVRRRDFADGHAERWTRDDWRRGVQADHMTLRMDGKEFNSFRTVCPRTQRQHARVYSRATSGVARSFLREVVEALSPERIQGEALPLKVLPPRSPELNGMVERANRSERVERWSQHRGEVTCAALNESQSAWLDYYNNRRPHRGLGMKTPAEAAVAEAAWREPLRPRAAAASLAHTTASSMRERPPAAQTSGGALQTFQKDPSGRLPGGENACHGCYGRPHGCLTSSCLEGR